MLYCLKNFINITKSKSKIVHLKAREEDQRKHAPDISKAKELLDWHPKIKLSNGLFKIIEWLKA